MTMQIAQNKMKVSRFCKFLEMDRHSSFGVNMLTRSIVRLDTRLAQALQSYSWNSPPASHLSEDQLEMLRQAGILVSEKEDEIATLQNWLERIKFDFTAVKAVILLTTRCNLSCTYCFEKGLLADTNRDMISNVAERTCSWLEALVERNNTKEINIYFYGGEPALKANTMARMTRDLMALGREKNLAVNFHMFTNGTILTNKLLCILKEADFRTIQITLDGPQKVHDRRRPFKNGNGTFEIVYQNIKRILADSQTHVRLTVNFDRDNCESVPILLDMFEGLQGSNLEFAYSPVFITAYNASACKHYSQPDGQSAEVWAELYKETLHRGFRCNPLRIFETGPCTFWRASHLIFDPVGDIYKCIGMPGRNELKIGNVAEGLNSHTLERVSQLSGITPWDNDRCLSCAYLPLCLGGCRFHSLEQNGNIENTFCHKDLIESCELELLKYVVSHD